LASQRAGGGYKDRLKVFAHSALDPLVRGLVSIGLTPDHLTWTGLALSLLAAFAFYDGQSRVAAAILIAGGVCDILDGQIARVGNRVTRFGAFLDSTLDRLGESFVLLGLAGFYASNLLGVFQKAGALVTQVVSGEVEGPLAVLQLQNLAVDPRTWLVMTIISVLALIGSFMVSYTRARAEGLGLDCKVGWFERPERLVLLIIAGLFQVFYVMSVALLLLTLFSFLTAFQRMAHVWRLTRGAGSDS
jgi:CDP-diacylglycerol--glycerol-3-phosphate 3-phosphatidyltransferase